MIACPKLVTKLPDPAPDGWFKKDGALIGSIISDPTVQSALARLYLHTAMNAPDFDPEVIPPAMQGLKEVWSLVQGVKLGGVIATPRYPSPACPRGRGP